MLDTVLPFLASLSPEQRSKLKDLMDQRREGRSGGWGWGPWGRCIGSAGPIKPPLRSRPRPQPDASIWLDPALASPLPSWSGDFAAMASERELASAARAWPFEEARKLVERTGGKTPDKGYSSSKPAMAPRACRISAPSARWCARPWSARPSAVFRRCRRGSSPFPTIWTGCAKFPTTSRTRRCCGNIWGTVDADGIEHGGLPLTRIPDPFGCHESFGLPQQRPAPPVSRQTRLRLRVFRARPTGISRAFRPGALTSAGVL
jgi:hypothetical protein